MILVRLNEISLTKNGVYIKHYNDCITCWSLIGYINNQVIITSSLQELYKV